MVVSDQNAQPWQPKPEWDQPVWGWSFQNVVDFAKAHHKPMGVWEAGNGKSEPPFGPRDDPYFIEWLAALSHPRNAKRNNRPGDALER